MLCPHIFSSYYSHQLTLFFYWLSAIICQESFHTCNQFPVYTSQCLPTSEAGCCILSKSLIYNWLMQEGISGSEGILPKFWLTDQVCNTVGPLSASLLLYLLSRWRSPFLPKVWLHVSAFQWRSRFSWGFFCMVFGFVFFGGRRGYMSFRWSGFFFGFFFFWY